MATDQELVAGVLVALLYVQGLDLSVGDAGTVLVNGGGRSTGETCPPGQGGVERKHGAWEWRVCLGLVGRVRDVAEKQASGNMGCEGT